MELYELRPKTLEILESLRKTGSEGVDNYHRANGKSTALLLRAKELMDNGEPVCIACRDPEQVWHNWRQLYPQAVDRPLCVTRPQHAGGGRKAYILVDEPWLLRWSNSDWDTQHRRFTVESVGRWFE